MKRIITLLFFIGLLRLFAQAQPYSVHGKVLDKTTKAALPFVNLVVTGYPQLGATADIDGNFKISAPFPIKSLSFTYVGYHDVLVPVKDTGMDASITVKMQQTAYQLGEVKILPGINPALRIIEAAVRTGTGITLKRCILLLTILTIKCIAQQI
jgi:hypothetical protein